jgi:uncharacterized iron-regulated membrane protein
MWTWNRPNRANEVDANAAERELTLCGTYTTAMPRSLLTLLLLALLSQTFTVVGLKAQSLIDPARSRDTRNDRGNISLDEAVQMAQNRYKARAVKAEISSDGDQRVYVIRLLNDSGRVWTVRVDAQTGRMR